MQINETYLESMIRRFAYFKLLGEKTFDQLEDSELHWRYNENQNSITTIVKHLSGNMVSRWTDFLTTDGEKVGRDRDREFQNESLSRDQMMELWKKGWAALFTTLHSLTPADLNKTIYINKEAHTVVDAINSQLAHYASHIGQIILIGKMREKNWTSLGMSNQFNVANFPSHTFKSIVI